MYLFSDMYLVIAYINLHTLYCLIFWMVLLWIIMTVINFFDNDDGDDDDDDDDFCIYNLSSNRNKLIF